MTMTIMRFFFARPTPPTALLALLTCTAWIASCVAPVTGALATTGTSAATGGASSAPSSSTTTTTTTQTTIPTNKPTGIATWFGPGFYGQRTACGQTLTPAVVGVANRTLPCGTLVKVSYGGHTLTVPVLDRGPYANHADWDLTAGAAQALDITETVRIHARVVGAAPNTPMLGSPAVTPAEAATGGAQAGG
jgi:rare lipoprotein A (peptidoglycan hydrolase)